VSDRPIRVLVADDHPVVRRGLESFLALHEDIDVVGSVEDGEAAVAAARRLQPDVVLLDVVMPGIGGIEALRRILEERPATRVVVLTSYADDRQMLACVRAGAAGFLLKDAAPAELVRAVRAAHRGEAVVHPSAAARLMAELRHEDELGLTAREREVLRLLAAGLANREIAARLVVSERTVKTHVSHVLAKLGVADRTQAAMYAVREGLVDPADTAER
jgi:NarL family two-component system response regulator LiaR